MRGESDTVTVVSPSLHVYLSGSSSKKERPTLGFCLSEAYVPDPDLLYTHKISQNVMIDWVIKLENKPENIHEFPQLFRRL